MEWINQLVGFLIVLFIFLFPIVRALLLKKQQKKESIEEEVATVDEEIDEEPLIESVPLTVGYSETSGQKFDFHSSLEVKPKRARKPKVSPIERILKERGATQAMVILSEILKKR